MGLPLPERQPPEHRPVVAFDFDGTLTTRDSFTAFLAWRAGPLHYALGLLRLAPALGLYLLRRDRGRLKAATVREFLSGQSSERLAEQAQAFAQSRAARLLRPDALVAWTSWKTSGALMLIVTASPEILVEPFARSLGADGLIGTLLKIDGKGRLTGALDGENCRGAEKVRRISAQFGTDIALAAAYGDTSGDREMLQMATVRGYRVFKGKP
jgi:phosphatidylglycerophosphatase C